MLHIMQYLSWALQGSKSDHWDTAWLWSIGDHIVVYHSYNTDKTDLPFVYAEHMYSVWAVLDYFSYPSALLYNACFSLGERLYWTIHVSSTGSCSIMPLTIESHKLNRKGFRGACRTNMKNACNYIEIQRWLHCVSYGIYGHN